MSSVYSLSPLARKVLYIFICLLFSLLWCNNFHMPFLLNLNLNFSLLLLFLLIIIIDSYLVLMYPKVHCLPWHVVMQANRFLLLYLVLEAINRIHKTISVGRASITLLKFVCV